MNTILETTQRVEVGTIVEPAIALFRVSVENCAGEITDMIKGRTYSDKLFYYLRTVSDSQQYFIRRLIAGLVLSSTKTLIQTQTQQNRAMTP